MKNLKIVVAHPEVKVQLYEDTMLITEKKIVSDRALSRHLLEAIDELMKEHHLQPTQISTITAQEEEPSFSATRTARIVASMLTEAWDIA